MYILLVQGVPLSLPASLAILIERNNGIQENVTLDYVFGDYVKVLVEFSEGVRVTGQPFLSLYLNNNIHLPLLFSSQVTDKYLLFSYPLSDPLLTGTIACTPNAIELNGGTIVQLSNFLPVKGTSLSLASLGGGFAFISSSTPVVVRVGSPGFNVFSNNGGTGQVLIFLVQFSEAVKVVGSPTLRLDLGPNPALAGFIGYATSVIAAQSYRVQTGINGDGSGFGGAFQEIPQVGPLRTVGVLADTLVFR
jgi:hypothetical protein